MTRKYESINYIISNTFFLCNSITGSPNKLNKVVEPIENITQFSVSSSVRSLVMSVLLSSLPSTSSIISSPISPLPSTYSIISGSKLNSFIIRTTKKESKAIDSQIAKFIYGTNSSFRHVEHKDLKK